MKIGVGWKIVIGIGVSFLIIVAGNEILKKRSYDEDGRVIASLFTEFQKYDFPTTSSELQPPIPDDQNAWTLIGEEIQSRAKAKNTRISDQIPILLNFATKKDSNLVKSILETNRKEAELFKRIILEKRNLLVKRNYGLGVALLHPELAYIRDLIRWYLVDAQLAGWKGDFQRVDQNLNATIILTNSLLAMPTPSDKLFAIVGITYVLDCLLNLVETNPQWEAKLLGKMKELKGISNLSTLQVIKSDFFTQLATIQVTDFPTFDERTYIWPFSLLVTKKTEANPLSLLDKVQARPDRWIPVHSNSRRVLKNLMESWLPIAQSVSSSKDLATTVRLADELKVFLKSGKYGKPNPTQISPSALSQILKFAVNDNNGAFADTETIFKVAEARYLATVAVQKSISFRNQSGSWPTSWEQLGIPPVVNPVIGEPLQISSTTKGILIQSGRFTAPALGPQQDVKASYPRSLRDTPERVQRGLQRMSELRTKYQSVSPIK